MAKKHIHEEHENLERWLVSYADFITLLFAFFVVLYALGQTDKKKYQEAVANIQKAFLSSGGVFPHKGSPFSPFSKDESKGSHVPPSTMDNGSYSKTEQEAMSRIAEQVKGVFERSTGLSPNPDDVEVMRTANGFKIRLGEAMLFKPGSDKLKREQIPFLYEMGKRLERLKLPIQIEGHSDSLEAKGTHNEVGWQMSVNRSYNMLRFMVEGAQFPKDKISIAGYGDSQPLASNESAEGRAKNRRVEISVITPDQKIHELPW